MKSPTRFATALLTGWCCLVCSSASAANLRIDSLAADVPPTPPVSSLGDSDPDVAVHACCSAPGCEADCLCCRWQVWANAIGLSRSGAGGMSLAFGDPDAPKGSEVYNTEDLHFGFGWGPNLGVARCLNPCTRTSLSAEFFCVNGWVSEGQVAGNISVQFPSFPYLPEQLDPTDPNSGYGVAKFRYTSNLYNTEVNLRRGVGDVSWLTMLAGFRWIELSERFGTVFETGGTTPNFTMDVNNHLYGFQLGALAGVQRCGPWFFDGWLKAGVYANAAGQDTFEDFTSAGGMTAYVSARDTNVAFAGDVGVSVGRRITDRLSARLGYMAMWIEGVALAPEQLDNSDPANAAANLDNSGGVFYHGGFAGIEYVW